MIMARSEAVATCAGKPTIRSSNLNSLGKVHPPAGVLDTARTYAINRKNERNDSYSCATYAIILRDDGHIRNQRHSGKRTAHLIHLDGLLRPPLYRAWAM